METRYFNQAHLTAESDALPAHDRVSTPSELRVAQWMLLGLSAAVRATIVLILAALFVFGLLAALALEARRPRLLLQPRQCRRAGWPSQRTAHFISFQESTRDCPHA